ncbi:MAG: hypothetical protein KBH11_05275 [Bacteroidia bacterium]|nr:hypothetical protein [Bacteroidia bacterium]
MNDILYIGEAMKILKYKHYSSFNRWCQRNKVKTFKEYGGKRKYVVYVLFYRARLKDVAEYLLAEFQCDWQSFLIKYSMLEGSFNDRKYEHKTSGDKSISEKENYYQSRLQKKLREL